jgi:hypothetical protein
MGVHHIHRRETPRSQAFRQGLHGHCRKIGPMRPFVPDLYPDWYLGPCFFCLTMP